MLGLDFIKSNRADVERAIRDKGVDVDLDALLALDGEARALKTEIDNLRASRNAISARFKDAAPEEKAALGAEAKAAGAKASELEEQLGSKQEALNALMLKLPGIPWEGAPVGSDDDIAGLVGADRRSGPRDSGQLEHQCRKRFLFLLELRFQGRGLGARFLGNLAKLRLLVRACVLEPGADRVALGAEVVDFGLERARFAIERKQRVEVEVDPLVADRALDLGALGFDEIEAQHGGPSARNGPRRQARPANGLWNHCRSAIRSGHALRTDRPPRRCRNHRQTRRSLARRCRRRRGQGDR